MSGDFLTYVDISDAIKGAYCPRQAYNASSEFEETEFFTRYCTYIPCCGDIECNRKECWKMLESGAPYVQNEYVLNAQTPTSMDEFFKRLGDYARDSGIKKR